MAYHSSEEMKQLLKNEPFFQEKLYCRGFLLTTQQIGGLDNYPFYGNWRELSLNTPYHLYLHKDAYGYTYTQNGVTYFLIGHAYDPFTMQHEEDVILRQLADAREISEDAFWEAESNLTGVFCLGFIDGGKIVYSTDCAGMQLTYHGTVQGQLYLTSHSKLVADLCGLEQDPYITRLVNSRFYHYYGTWLPADLSAFRELKRLQSNHFGCFKLNTQHAEITRYYPTKAITASTTEEEYRNTIQELSVIMARNMELIAKKWPHKKVAISVTGGRDSLSTVACANGLYDKFHYFSYISNEPESVDAHAAHDICSQLNLEHQIYEIPSNGECYNQLSLFQKILECNAGCIGANNLNDAKKRLYFSINKKFDVEVKSWVNEIGRGRYFRKYNKTRFPKKLTASYCRAMHKIYLSPKLIHDTNIIFRQYLDTYYANNIFEKLPWTDLFYWEFVWGGGEGVFLTSEHRVSYDITIPFNNRRYVEKMLTVPLQKRIDDQIPIDLTDTMNPCVNQCGISVRDVEHTDFRALIERIYLEIFSLIKF